MSRSRFFPLFVAALALTACGAGDDSTEPPEEDVTDEQTEDALDADGPDTETADQSQTDGSEAPTDLPDPEETALGGEAEDPAVEASVEYVATAEGPGQVAAGFGNHDFQEFTDSWTESEEVDSGPLSMSVEAEGTVTCEILVDGESVVEEQDENGSVYCSGVIQ